jgi:hypothetical protein
MTSDALHRNCLRRLCRAVRRGGRVLLLAVALATPPPVARAESSEAALKVAFLYNFALYTEWPALGSAFEFCVIGRDALGEALDALAAKAVAGRPVHIRRLNGDTVPGDCNLLFVGASESAHLGKLLPPLAGRPVLTVAEGAPDTSAKPMLRLTLDQGRLTFDANQAAARAAGLSFSAKLLRLARSVQ